MQATGGLDVIIHAVFLKQTNTAQSNSFGYIKHLYRVKSIVSYATNFISEKLLTLSTDEASSFFKLLRGNKTRMPARSVSKRSLRKNIKAFTSVYISISAGTLMHLSLANWLP